MPGEDLFRLEVMQPIGHLLGEVEGLLPVLILKPQLGELGTDRVVGMISHNSES